MDVLSRPLHDLGGVPGMGVYRGLGSGSNVRPQRIIDGAALEKLSDGDSRFKPRCVSEIQPIRPRISSGYKAVRQSIDGANLEAISDGLNAGRLLLRRSVSPKGTTLRLPENSYSTAPQRSKVTNHARRPPSKLLVAKRRNINPENKPEEQNSGHRISLNSPFTPELCQPRPSPFQLPKLSIPDNRRPPVELIESITIPRLGTDMNLEDLRSV
jgi:hypothetical protein